MPTLSALEIFAFILALLIAPSFAAGQLDVVTYHYDNLRSGQNTHESTLTPASVNQATFGKLFSHSVDGQIYAQPLELQNIGISGKGRHNVVYVATENDSVYAFDADDNHNENASPLWQVSFINPANNITPIPSSDVGTTMIYPNIGITSTPVVDVTSSTLYVMAATKESGTYVQRLHALDVASGAEKFGGPVVIQASVPGTGWGSWKGMISFDPLHENQRAGLLLSKGVVYIAWASHGLEDNAIFHGWVIGYNASALTQVAAFNTTPNGKQGGVWQSGDGIAADALGNLFLVTGNGTFDLNNGGQDCGMSYLKLKTGTAITLSDFFTPYNEESLSEEDLDLGSGGPLLLPYQAGAAHPYLAIGAGKDGVLYLVDRTKMGHYNSAKNQVVESITDAFNGHGLYATPAYWQEKLYFAAAIDVLRIFQITDGIISTSAIATSTVSFDSPGATPVISANGTSNGIAWLLGFNRKGGTLGYGGPAVLHAFDPNTAAELYNSNQAGNRDTAGPSIKFATPIVANGKVYVGTANQLDVYGLF